MKWLLAKYKAINFIQTDAELSSLTGIKSTTLKDRKQHPENLRLFEVAALDEVLHFSNEDLIGLLRLARGEI